MCKYLVNKDSISVDEPEKLVLDIVNSVYAETRTSGRTSHPKYGVSFDSNWNQVKNQSSQLHHFYKKHVNDVGPHREVLTGNENLDFTVKVFEALHNLTQKGILVEVSTNAYYLTSLYRNGQCRQLPHPKPAEKERKQQVRDTV